MEQSPNNLLTVLDLLGQTIDTLRTSNFEMFERLESVTESLYETKQRFEGQRQESREWEHKYRELHDSVMKDVEPQNDIRNAERVLLLSLASWMRSIDQQMEGERAIGEDAVQKHLEKWGDKDLLRKVRECWIYLTQVVERASGDVVKKYFMADPPPDQVHP